MEIAFALDEGERHRQERGFGFACAARVFARRPEVSATRMVGGEPRMKAVGEIEGERYTVIFVDRGDARRIISARPASRRERREWLRSE